MLSTGVACSLIPWDLLQNVTQQWIQKFTRRYLALNFFMLKRIRFGLLMLTLREHTFTTVLSKLRIHFI